VKKGKNSFRRLEASALVVGYVRRYPKYSRLTLLLTPYSMRS
jgi:glucan phosphorylase